MSDDDFEWDEAKAAANYRNHGVTFAQAKKVFADPCAIERADDREDYGEDRFNLIGVVHGRLLFVCLHVTRRHHTNNLRTRSRTL